MNTKLPRTRYPLAACLLCAFVGCVGAGPPLDAGVVVLEAQVSDARGGAWAARDAPRRPVVKLLLGAGHGPMEGRVAWVRGEPTREVLEDLLDPPLRASSQDAQLPFEMVEVDGSAQVSLQQPLQAGERSTLLVWSGPPRGEDADPTDGWWQLHLRGSSSPAAGARLTASLPAEGSLSVAAEIHEALLQWDGYVTGLAKSSARVRAPNGPVLDATVRPFDCADIGLADGTCAWLRWSETLPLETWVTVQLVGTLHDTTGIRLDLPSVRFFVGGDSPPTPRLLPPVECAVDERETEAGCGRADGTRFYLRTGVSRDGILQLASSVEHRARIVSAGDSTLGLRVGADAWAAWELRTAETLRGRPAVSGEFTVWSEPDLPALRLGAILADPLGREPDQEYVLLVNQAANTVPLKGWSLATGSAAGVQVLDDIRLPPGEAVYAVPPGFQRGDAPTVAAGAPLAQLSGNLRLPNSGSEVFLRDPRGRRVDTSPAVPVAQGQCLVADFAHTPRERSFWGPGRCPGDTAPR